MYVVFLTEELERASWVDKVLVTLLLLLRDWLMVLPLKSLTQDTTITQDTIRTIFEVSLVVDIQGLAQDNTCAEFMSHSIVVI